MIAISLPAVFVVSQHNDEDQYGWAAGYFGRLVVSGDLSHTSRSFDDPRWDPFSYWGRAMGTKFIYAGGMAATGAKPPVAAFSYSDPASQGPETRLDRRALLTLRLVGLLCAAVGALLLGLRFGWAGVGAVGVVLVIPEGWKHFSRAWAEGPLLLGFGLCAVAFRTRWFPFAAGVAATFKLTAIGLWPILLLRGSAGSWPRWTGVILTLTAWTILTPPSWAAFGPLDLLTHMATRISEYQGQQAETDGLWLPSRYVWPFQLAAALVVFTRLPLPKLVPRVGPGPTAN